MKYLKLVVALLLCNACHAVYAQQDTIEAGEGMRYIVLQKGSGEQAVEGQEVEFNVTTTQEDGTLVFSSQDLGFPFYETLSKEKNPMITAAMFTLQVGGKNRLFLNKDALPADDGMRNLPGDIIIIELELLNVGTPKEDVATVIAQILESEGIASAEAKFNALHSDQNTQYPLREGPLNALGYKLMSEGKLEAAVAVFKMNISAHPKSHNVYDSLGDGYVALASQQYAQVLKINPEATYTKEKLAKLED